MSVSVLNTDAGLSGKTIVTSEGTATVTGLHTFDRDPSAPFAVTSGSAAVANLDADKLDGQEGAYYQDPANLSSVVPIAKGGTGAATAAANVVFAGPTSGGSAAPSFRALVAADLPSAGTNCSAYNSATQSINNNTDTAVIFNTEDFDTGTMHDTVTNNTRFTAPTAGVYDFSAHIVWAGVSGGIRTLRFKKNGSTNLPGYVSNTPGGTEVIYQNLNIKASLAANDYVEVIVFQNSGGGVNIGDGSTRYLQASCEVAKIN